MVANQPHPSAPEVCGPQDPIPDFIATCFRAHFLSFLGASRSYDMKNPEVNPFKDDPRHRAVYIPENGEVGLSVMSSFGADSSGKVRLCFSCWWFRVHKRVLDIPLFVGGEIPDRGFQPESLLRCPCWSLRTAGQIFPNVAVEYLGTLDGIVHLVSVAGRPVVEDLLIGLAERGG